MIYRTVRGAGPVLLLIPGGGGDADSFTPLADLLVDTYTVVTYDRRGYARSTMEDPETLLTVGDHGDDAAALLAEVGGPALVFGTSAGALVGLDLAIRHPAAVRRLVAHEPPAVYLLPLDERPTPPPALGGADLGSAELAAVARQFRDAVGADEVTGTTPHAAANRRHFFTHEIASGMLDRYRLDLDALHGDRITIAAGAGSRGHFPYRCAVAVARALGTSLVELPGGHNGYLSRPHEFAEDLRKLLLPGAQ